MSGSTQTPPDGGGSPYVQPPSGAWTQSPAWTPSSAWTPSGGWAPAAAAAEPVPGRGRAVVLVLVGAAAGALVAALVGVVLLLAGAREMVVEAGAVAGEGIASGMYDDIGVYGYEYDEEGAVDPYAMPEPEQFPAVEPGALGPDPVLDAYAQGCFGGDLQGCDDLFVESPPLSEYEQYGGTCGGRVKLGSVYACTELD